MSNEKYYGETIFINRIYLLVLSQTHLKNQLNRENWNNAQTSFLFTIFVVTSPTSSGRWIVLILATYVYPRLNLYRVMLILWHYISFYNIHIFHVECFIISKPVGYEISLYLNTGNSIFILTTWYVYAKTFYIAHEYNTFFRRTIWNKFKINK